MSKANCKSTATPRPTADPPIGSQDQYRKFLPIAEQLPKAEIRVMRADASLASINAASGVEAVLAHATDIDSMLPGVSLDAIRTLGNLASAVAYAAGQVERFAPPPSDVKPMLKRAQELRTLLLASADVLAIAKIVPAATVAKIHRGRGAIDTAGDCVALAALFHKHAAAIKGKVLVTSTDIDAASKVGTYLLQVLRPHTARRTVSSKELVDAMTARDRLWTLLEQTWEQHVWRAGAWLFGRDVDEHVPPLQSRVLGKRAPKPVPIPAPPPPPAPAPSPPPAIGSRGAIRVTRARWVTRDPAAKGCSETT